MYWLWMMASASCYTSCSVPMPILRHNGVSVAEWTMRKCNNRKGFAPNDSHRWHRHGKITGVFEWYLNTNNSWKAMIVTEYTSIIFFLLSSIPSLSITAQVYSICESLIARTPQVFSNVNLPSRLLPCPLMFIVHFTGTCISEHTAFLTVDIFQLTKNVGKYFLSFLAHSQTSTVNST